MEASRALGGAGQRRSTPPNDPRRRIAPLRIGLAALLAAVVLWAVTPWFTHRISSQAVINAEVVRFSAPIPGLAAADLPEPGTTVPAGAELVLVVRYTPDEREKFRLEAELFQVQSRIQRARTTLARLDQHEREVRDRHDRLEQAVLALLDAEAEETEAALAAARARVAKARADLRHAEEMRALGLWSVVRVEAAKVAVASAEAEAEAAAAKLRRLAAERRALGLGARLRDGYNDVPYSQQQMDRILILRENVLDRLAEAEAQEWSLTQALMSEVAAQRSRQRFAPRLPSDMVVLRRHVTPGSPVQAGQVLLDLIDCRALFVDLALPDRAFRDLSIEMPAEIVLPGGRRLSGRISALRGGATRREEPLLAADFPKPKGDFMVVRLSLPPDAVLALTEEHRQEEGPAFCGVGRFAEVLIPTTGFLAVRTAFSRVADFVAALVEPFFAAGPADDAAGSD